MEFRELLTLWFFHVAFAAAVSIPIAAFTPRAAWKRWELLAFVVPYSLWAVATALHNRGNALYAFSALTLAIPVAALVRVRLSTFPEAQRLVAAFVFSALCLFALGLYFLLPPRHF